MVNFSSNASCSKIDRIFLSKEWLDRNPKVYLKGLPRPVSDHSPLFLSTEGLQGGPTPFRFENMWLRHKNFKESVLSWWNQPQITGWAAFRIQQKLRLIKQQLKDWNKEVLGSLDHQKAAFLTLERLDKKESESDLSEEELMQRNKLKRSS